MPIHHTRAHILAIGGAHIDRRGRMTEKFAPGASNPGRMDEEVGGGVFNALRSIVQRGHGASLMSMRGGDAGGQAVAAAVDRAGIDDLPAVFLDRVTPSYTALLDDQGELVAGLADMSLYDLGFVRHLRRKAARQAIDAADAILLDANIPAPGLELIARQAGSKPVFAIAISPAKVLRLKPVLPALSVLFLNRREAIALTGLPPQSDGADLARGLRALGLRRAAISAGPQALFGLDETNVFSIAPPAPERVADVTGAGDALAGATIAAILAGHDFAGALREGLAAASICIETPRSVPQLDEPHFSAALARIAQPAILAKCDP
ncbi:carbohydrate kinase family protein [Mesorhizobium xinjiangense]|uniref:carbohydrate kinase family protein n=1 Tax=Mesorhizobium xinjiangense TaxID=2678685 RepID=UPI0012EE578B|nr:carbohydrate kinase family protein [Mesorhizobium xinjiangense]